MPFDGTLQFDDFRIVSEMEALLAISYKWCKGCYARTAYGDKARVSDPSAVSFCLEGALCRVSRHRHPYDIARAAESSVCEVMEIEATARGFPNHIAGFNDSETTTHADILDFLHHVRRRLQNQLADKKAVALEKVS